MNKKAQVAPFMVMLVAVLFLAIVATMIIGEAGFQRIRMANMADSALISASSKFSQSLNQIKIIHKRLFLSYLQVQTALLLRGVWATKAEVVWALSTWAYGLTMSYQLFNEAKKIARDMPKNLRSSLYDVSFGGALVDEPKPFIDIPGGDPTRPFSTFDPQIDTCDEGQLRNIGWDEVGCDPEPNGRVNYLDYDKYAARDVRIACAYRNLKRSNLNWYTNNAISYSFNKNMPEAMNNQGQFSFGGPLGGYESFLQVELQDIPTGVAVKNQWFPLFFLWYCGTSICPGILPHPYAWIRKVDFNKSFGFRLIKHFPLRRLPFFGRVDGTADRDLTHTSRVRINGSVWTGYDFVLE